MGFNVVGIAGAGAQKKKKSSSKDRNSPFQTKGGGQGEELTPDQVQGRRETLLGN